MQNKFSPLKFFKFGNIIDGDFFVFFNLIMTLTRTSYICIAKNEEHKTQLLNDNHAKNKYNWLNVKQNNEINDFLIKFYLFYELKIQWFQNTSLS